MKDPNSTGIFCPHCNAEFDYTDLPWSEDETVDKCFSCDQSICIAADITIKHKVAKSHDELDFVEAI